MSELLKKGPMSAALLCCALTLFAGEPTVPLSLTQSLDAASRFAPEQQALATRRHATDAALKSAGRWQDPELSTEIEELSLGGDQSGLDNAEITVALTQPLPLPGQRRLQRAFWQGEQQVVAAAQTTQERELRAATQTRYFALLAAQERVAVLAAELQLAEQVAEVVRRKADAGKVAPLEAEKAELQVVRARLALDESEQQRHNHVRALYALWGETPTTTPRLTTAWPAPIQQPARFDAADHPSIAALTAQRDQNTRALDLLKRNRFGTPALTLGGRRNGIAGETTYVAGLSLRLPLWNGNHTQRAPLRLNLADQEAAIERGKPVLNQTWHTTQLRLKQIEHRLEVTRTTLLPTARRLFERLSTGYRQGKFAYLEVLDAQRELFRGEEELIDLQLARANQLIALENLSGQTLIQHDSNRAQGEKP